MKMILPLLLTIAAIYDLRQHRVPNSLCVFGMGLGLLIRSFEGPSGLGDAALGMLLPMVILFIPVCFSMLGAGDVKVLMMAGSFAGREHIFAIMLGSFLIAAGWSLYRLIRYDLLRERFVYLIRYAKTVSAGGKVLPYVDMKQVKGNERWTIPFCAAIWMAVMVYCVLFGGRI